MIADRLKPFGTTIFTEMTLLAQKHGAVNLAQGFPDFDGPDFVKRAAVEAIQAGRGQYARMFGDPALNAALAAQWKRLTGREVNADTEVTVTSGCTEAIAAALLGVLNPGDGVILFQPYYDSYRACVAMAGGRPIFVTLRPPEAGGPGISRAPFEFDEAELKRAFEQGPRAIVINTPHNPTGKVFSSMELELIAGLCREHGVVAITDEVYEFLTYDPERPHVRLATIEGMADRTITLSSLGKTFSLTGWKIGWAIASPELSRAVRAAHQFLTFATATPLQLAAAAAIEHGQEYIQGLVKEYAAKRAYLANEIASMELTVFLPEGTYFIMVDHRRAGKADDLEFCRFLTERVGVAAIPPGVFYDEPSLGRTLARFAFCKRWETLEEAVKRLRRLWKA